MECDDGEVDRNRIEREEGGRVGEEGGREGGRDLRMMRGGRAELRSSSSPADVKGKTAKGVLSSHASPFRFHPPPPCLVLFSFSTAVQRNWKYSHYHEGYKIRTVLVFGLKILIECT